ncbi:unnamed protein product [Caenorhabditis bovis]|uniref:ARID domain-containing protein n=1 Tax=Caenorhabditis bovis TaxID=2654633 RepID=A0A8S1F131_9PELO|nr:unnamed protein product [Caenorhabditis bovis]
MESYIESLTDPLEKQRKIQDFYHTLRMFYKKRWNAPLLIPCVQGVEVNLFRLYDTVQALGGWQKVAAGEKWSNVAEILGCKDDVVCGDHAIKLIYMRYLSKYEQIQTIGDVDDFLDNDLGRGRGRGTSSFFATNECPISSNRLHPYVPRDERGNIIQEHDYSKLIKSLLTGLPNETDFAVNVCMLLSHTGPKQLRISNAPTLLTVLVAHAGIYDDENESLADLGPVWKEASNHDFPSFWAACGAPKELIAKYAGPHIARKEVDEDEEFFTGLNHSFSVHDPVSWRLNQIATIIRNLSFEPVNRITIVRTWPVMKFLLLCANCRWAPLYTAAFDALGNLASDIDLADKTLVHIADHAILRLVNDGIFSSDKFKIIRSLEILTGLAAFEGNEATICEWLNSKTINHIFEIIGIKDIMMCVYTLECLYQISEMGDTACDIIADAPCAIQQLVTMATMEAVSFGPGGLSGMKTNIRLGATIPVQPIVPSANTGESQLEQLTEKWIRANCVFEPTMSTPRGELYAVYVDDLRNQYHSLSGSLAMFSGVMKNIYPGVNFRMAENGIMIVAQGIRLVRPHRLAPAASKMNDLNEKEETHPLMKKMLSKKDPPMTNGINGHAEEAPEPEKVFAKRNGTVANGHVEICKDPIPASRLIDSSKIEEVKIERKMNGTSPIDKETDVISDVENDKNAILNGKITNGSKMETRKKASMASRAASIVAQVTAKIDEEKKMSNGNEAIVNGNGPDEATTSAPAPQEVPPVVEEKKPIRKGMEPSSVPTEYMCDWDCCSLYYSTPGHVLKHLSEEHVVEELRLLCRWNGCSDPTPRNRWSLVTHIQDAHCNETQLKIAAAKRRDGIAIRPTAPRNEIVPRDYTNHPGYSKTAAMDAVRRHAFNFVPRDITDECEGPVTKSIRLTSCLILRNLARYSAEGRKKLRRHESHICWLALSRLESSHALAQLLSELQEVAVTSDEQQGSLSTAPSSASLCSSASGAAQHQVPESPTSSNFATPKLEQQPARKPIGASHKPLNFASAHLPAEMPPPALPCSSSRHPALQQHLPGQPSPLVQTTPLRAGVGR